MQFASTLLCIFLACSQADSNLIFSHNVEKMWFEGNKDKIAKLAQERLKADPGDIVGLLLKLEYEIEFVKLDNIPGTLQRFEQAGNKITTPNFKEAWPEAQSLIGMIREVLPHYTKKAIETDRRKAAVPGQPMMFLFLLQAAEKDGLVKPKALANTNWLKMDRHNSEPVSV